MVEIVSLVIGIVGAVGAAVSLIIQALGGCNMRESTCCAFISRQTTDVHDNEIMIRKVGGPPPAL